MVVNARGIDGIDVVEPFEGHTRTIRPMDMDRYITKQVFRYNNRATKDNPLTDSDRFPLAVNQITGKRLTFAELTGKEDSGRGVRISVTRLWIQVNQFFAKVIVNSSTQRIQNLCFI